MNHLQAIIMVGLQRINEERTVYAIYHLLTGRKSSQTIQDAHLYQLTHLFKLYPRLTRIKFKQQIENLSNEFTYITYNHQDSTYTLTEQGKQQLQIFMEEYPFPQYIHGWKYQDAAIHLWQRLTLLTQVASHLIYKENRYYPVQRDPALLEWMKLFLKAYQGNRYQLSTELYSELMKIFSNGFPEDPLVIALRLSGYNRVGLTADQVALRLHMEQTEFDLRFMNSLHYIIRTVLDDELNYPLIASLFLDIYQSVPYTQSTLMTYNLLKKNYSIEQIAATRNLKKSTIEDHIIEIALIEDHFSISQFVSKAIGKEVLQAKNQFSGKKLKPIKERVPHASYFQIRLVLAREEKRCDQV